MRHLFSLAILAMVLLGSGHAWAQKEIVPPQNIGVAKPHTTESGTRLSAAAAMLRADLEKLGRNVRRSDKELIERYALHRQRCRYYVRASVKPAEGHTLDELSDYGVRGLKGQPVGGQLAVSIPTRRLAKVIDSGVLAVVDISFPAKPLKK